jgi:hypothetical protein
VRILNDFERRVQQFLRLFSWEAAKKQALCREEKEMLFRFPFDYQI